MMGNREVDPNYEVNMALHRREIGFGEFIRSIKDVESSNDLYLVANNHLLDRPEAASLWPDLPAGDGVLSQDGARGATFLWIGPAGLLPRCIMTRRMSC